MNITKYLIFTSPKSVHQKVFIVRARESMPSIVCILFYFLKNKSLISIQSLWSQLCHAIDILF